MLFRSRKRLGERGGSEGEGESAEVSLKCLLREHRVCQEGCRGAGREEVEIPPEGEGVAGPWQVPGCLGRCGVGAGSGVWVGMSLRREEVRR